MAEEKNTQEPVNEATTDQQEDQKSPENQEAEAAQEETSTEEATETPEEETTASDETATLKAEISEQKDKYLRLYSEFDNFRRRTSKEKLELIKTASEKVMLDMISTLDDFERATQTFSGKEDNEEITPIKEGFDLIHQKLVKNLEKHGLKPMEDCKGQELDTDLHEAITQIPAPSEELKGKVVDVIEKGYYLEEKVIRYAKVVVGS